MIIYSCDNSVVIDDLDDIIEYDETEETEENTMGNNYLREGRRIRNE